MNSISRHKHLIVNSGLLVITLVYIFRDPGEPSQDITETQTPEKLSPKLKRILYWNDYYGSKNFGFCCGRGPYIKHKCPTSLCYTSKDRREDLKSFDAIVFHSRSLNPQDLPAVRYPHQLYVFLTIESAAYPGIEDWSPWNDFFNLTMTYRADSDVFMPYGRIVEKHHQSGSDHSPQRLTNKTGLVSWLVSNCNTRSKREVLVGELKKYLPADKIHVYGKCGSMKCSGASPDDRDGCWKMLEQKYKFYLALENSICPDYVTEKMFEALKHDIVPIVLGGADYDSIFPPNSFINMMDSKNMSSLAEYLTKLDSDDALYAKYFTWKSKYSVKNSKFDTNQAHCDLCQKLHNVGANRSKNAINLEKWFIDEKKCKS